MFKPRLTLREDLALDWNWLSISVSMFSEPDGLIFLYQVQIMMIIIKLLMKCCQLLWIVSAYQELQVMIPSTTGLRETAVVGSRLDQAGMKSASRGGSLRANGAFKAACHPEDKSSPPSLLVSPENVEINGRPLITHNQPHHQLAWLIYPEYISLVFGWHEWFNLRNWADNGTKLVTHVVTSSALWMTDTVYVGTLHQLSWR